MKGLNPILWGLVGVPNTSVVDAAGVVWQRTSIAEGTATVTIYTMLFATVLAAVKLLQPAPLASVEPGSPVAAKPVGAVEVTTAASYTG